MPPNYAEECAFRAQLGVDGLICGVDEVGRGPFAGPVVAAAAVLSEKAAARLATEGADDSKKLPERARDAIAALLGEEARRGEARWALAAASVAEIERLNILGATDLAMRRALGALARGGPLAGALIDGARVPGALGVPAAALVKGDGRSLSIAAAAILAKTARDRAMRRLAARYPGYGWETNVGYGSKAHRDALVALGPTPHHRRAFIAKTLALGQSKSA